MRVEQTIWRSLCAAALLLACDANRTPLAEPEPTGRLDPPATGTCRANEPIFLAESDGHGPVLAAPAADDQVVIAYDAVRGEGPGLVVAQIAGSDFTVRDSQWIAPTTAGPLLAESIAFDPSGLAVAARQTGGRRAYFFSGLPGTELRQVDAPGLGAIDRRIAVRLAPPQARSGIQVVTYVSGNPQLQVGRLAGGLLVTQPHDWADLVLAPEAASSARGDLLLAAVRAGEDERAIELRILAPNGSVAQTVHVSDIEPGARVEQVVLLTAARAYDLWWLVRAGEASELRRATVDAESGAVTLGAPLRADPDEVTPAAFSAVRRGDDTWLAWTGLGTDGAQLVVVQVDATGMAAGRHRIPGDGESWSSPQIVPLADGLAVVWRERRDNGAPGPVRMSRISCS